MTQQNSSQSLFAEIQTEVAINRPQVDPIMRRIGTRDRALLYAGGASFPFIASLVSLVSVSSALVFVAVGAFPVWSYRRSSRKKNGSLCE